MTHAFRTHIHDDEYISIVAELACRQRTEARRAAQTLSAANT